MYKTSVYTLLTATFKDLHIENSKNYKRRYCPHHTDCVNVPLYIYICCFITKILFSHWWSVTKILRFRYFLH